MADTIQQTWEQQYQALKSGEKTYEDVVQSLMKGDIDDLTPAQKVVLESSQRGHLDTGYQIRQFLNTDQRLLADAARLTHRLQRLPGSLGSDTFNAGAANDYCWREMA